MSRTYYIIEHPRRGCLTDMPGIIDDKPHFSWSGLRSDEKVRKFWNLGQAREAKQILLTSNEYWKSPFGELDLAIRRSSDWEAVG